MSFIEAVVESERLPEDSADISSRFPRRIRASIPSMPPAPMLPPIPIPGLIPAPAPMPSPESMPEEDRRESEASIKPESKPENPESDPSLEARRCIRSESLGDIWLGRMGGRESGTVTSPGVEPAESSLRRSSLIANALNSGIATGALSLFRFVALFLLLSLNSRERCRLLLVLALRHHVGALFHDEILLLRKLG